MSGDTLSSSLCVESVRLDMSVLGIYINLLKLYIVLLLTLIQVMVPVTPGHGEYCSLELYKVDI
jgi:hypothetical protein